MMMMMMMMMMMIMMMMAIDDDDDDDGDDDDAAAGDDGRDPMRLCVCNAHRWSGTDSSFGSHSSVSLLLSPRSLCSDVLGFQLCCVFMSVVLHF